MDDRDLQTLCELAQRQLMATEYLSAERTLMQAEHIALDRGDWDTLSRLYLPLQEARRQRRQLCGEGLVKLDFFPRGPDDVPDAESILAEYQRGQLLIAGWGSIEPARRFRQLQESRSLYVETFLAAVYPVGSTSIVVIVPTTNVSLPPPIASPLDQLISQLPAHSIVMHPSNLPSGAQRGNASTFAFTMSIWERLHRPFLAQADAESDPLRKISAYRRVIEVDYACELAHQKLSDAARLLAKRRE